MRKHDIPWRGLVAGVGLLVVLALGVGLTLTETVAVPAAVLTTAGTDAAGASSESEDPKEDTKMVKGIVNLTNESFERAVGSGVALVDFWAPWCGPCRMQTPILEEVAGKVDGKVLVAKLNVDDGGETAQKYGVQSIPTLVVFKDGQEVRRFVGVQTEGALLGALEAVN